MVSERVWTEPRQTPRLLSLNFLMNLELRNDKVLPLSLRLMQETSLSWKFSFTCMQHWSMSGLLYQSSFKWFWHFALKEASKEEVESECRVCKSNRSLSAKTEKSGRLLVLLELSPSAYETCGKLELELPLEDLFFDLLLLLGFAPPLSELSGGAEDEAAVFAVSFEQSKVW